MDAHVRWLIKKCRQHANYLTTLRGKGATIDIVCNYTTAAGEPVAELRTSPLLIREIADLGLALTVKVIWLPINVKRTVLED